MNFGQNAYVHIYKSVGAVATRTLLPFLWTYVQKWFSFQGIKTITGTNLNVKPIRSWLSATKFCFGLTFGFQKTATFFVLTKFSCSFE